MADSRNNRVWRMKPDGALATVIRGADYGLTSIAGLAPDSTGNLYVSDYRLGEPGRALRIGADGRSSVISASERSTSPGIAGDASDNLYIADPFANVVWKRSPAGVVQKVAGNGRYGTDGEGGLAVAASLQMPRRLAFDARGNLLIADSQRLLRLNQDGTLVRLAGVAYSYSGGLAGAADGSIYIANSGQVLRWDPSGAVTRLAGVFDHRFSDGCARSGGLRLARTADVFAEDVAVDAAGRIYVADSDHQRLRRIELNGEIRTLAGSGDRPRDPRVLYDPGALAVDEAGNVYFAEFSANRVRQITPTGEIRTLVGLNSPPPG